jgi:hypothetical protein
LISYSQRIHRRRALRRSSWSQWVENAIGHRVRTPGIPNVQWVCVSCRAGATDYATQWRAAQEALTARGRVHDFEEVHESGRRLCSLSARWVAEEGPPGRLPPRQAERLSAANWVKRRWGQPAGLVAEDTAQRIRSEDLRFPSASSIASAPFRLRVLRRLDDPLVRDQAAALRGAAPQPSGEGEPAIAGLARLRPGDELAEWLAAEAGTWMYPEARQPGDLRKGLAAGGSANDAVDADAVRDALHRLLQTMNSGIAAPPPSYLAVVAQNLDGMGAFLSGLGSDGQEREVSAQAHRRISLQLAELGVNQSTCLTSESLLGAPVYAAGGDLLAFTPASTALSAAQACHDLTPHPDLPRPSTAVLFFHRASSLRRAVTSARELLSIAKSSDDAHKHALAVGFLHRSGASEHSVQPWHTGPTSQPYDRDVRSAADVFGVFVGTAGGRGLSPRLIWDLERDAAQLADEALSDQLYRAELTRLLERHGGSVAAADALMRLASGERATPKRDITSRAWRAVPGRVPSRAARVAVFLSRECAG